MAPLVASDEGSVPASGRRLGLRALRASSGAFLLALAGFSALSAAAQEADGRFQLLPVDRGALRLDTRTGAMDLCADDGKGWHCRRVVAPPVAGGGADAGTPARAAGPPSRPRSADIERMRAALLEIAAIARAAAAPAGTRASALASAAQTRREIDEAIEVTDYTLRRFLDLYRTFQDLNPDGAPAGARGDGQD